MAEHAPPVVLVSPTADGTPMARWYRSLDDARDQNEVLTANRLGVGVGERWYLTDVPEEWVSAAKAAHRALKDGKDVSHLATHRHRFEGGGGPLDPVTPPAGG